MFLLPLITLPTEASNSVVYVSVTSIFLFRINRCTHSLCSPTQTSTNIHTNAQKSKGIGNSTRRTKNADTIFNQLNSGICFPMPPTIAFMSSCLRSGNMDSYRGSLVGSLCSIVQEQSFSLLLGSLNRTEKISVLGSGVWTSHENISKSFRLQTSKGKDLQLVKDAQGSVQAGRNLQCSKWQHCAAE